MLTSLILGLSLLCSSSLLGIEFALHAIHVTQEKQKVFAQHTRKLLPRFSESTLAHQKSKANFPVKLRPLNLQAQP